VKRFEAAHRLLALPEGHKCKRMHGHSYEVTMEFEGTPDAACGFVIDFAAIDAVWDEMCGGLLDHRYLNDVEGLEVPSVENICVWIYERVGLVLTELVAVEVWETHRGAARYEPKEEA
jgi:6-pyruvoyltetrahydropterin/6-carboxytetrahydropterin synthase